MMHSEPPSPSWAAAEAVLSAEPTAVRCISYLEQLFREEMQRPRPDIAKLSIALGAVEAPLTVKREADQQWPADLEQQVAACLEAFEGFVQAMHERLVAAGPLDARAKVKLVADAVWSKLTGAFSKDVLHAQHVYSFAQMLLPNGGAKGKRQLDCAGVVTTTYAVCERLAERHGHTDLAGCSMQISEDHCWLTLDPAGASREGSVEVTTDTAAKRGLPASEEAWSGWLYTGGGAVLCCARRAAAALVASLNPAITSGKNGQDSEQLQAAQYRLLRLLWREHRNALYPAALCCLADLKEVAQQDELDAALDLRDQQRLDAMLQRRSKDAQELFERAIAMAAGQEWRQEGPSAGPANSTAAHPAPRVAAGGEPDGAAACEGSVAGLGGACAPQAPAEPASTVQPGEGSSGSPPGALGYAAAEGQAVPANLCSQAPQQQQQPPQQQGSSDTSTAAAAEAVGSPAEATGSDPGLLFYPHSYLGSFLARRAEFLGKCAAAFPESAQRYAALALGSLRGALAAWAQGAGVLAKYRFSPTDEQLYKDVEGCLEACQDGLAAAAKWAAEQGGAGPGGNGSATLGDPTLLQPALRLWDGAFAMFAGKAKPGAWVGLLLKLAKVFTPEAREAAAAAEEPRSEGMLKARGMWGPLKPATLRPLLEAAGVAEGEARATKRPRR